MIAKDIRQQLKVPGDAGCDQHQLEVLGGQGEHEQSFDRMVDAVESVHEMKRQLEGAFRAVRSIDWSTVLENLQLVGRGILELHARFEAASKLPDHDKRREPWMAVYRSQMVLGDVVTVIRHLPNPLRKRGRPKGTGRVALDHDLLDELNRRIDEEKRPETTVAASILRERGAQGELKGRADYLVRVRKSRAKK